MAVELIAKDDPWEPKEYLEGGVIDVKNDSKAAKYLLDPRYGLAVPVDNVKAIAKEPALVGR